MKKYIPSVLIGILWGILQSLTFLNSTESVYLSDIVWKLSFPAVYFIPTSLIDMTFQMIPFFLFQAVYGIFLYRHFCTASVYYFTRCEQRKVWFLKELLHLYPIVLTYLLVNALFCIGIVWTSGHIVMDFTGCILFVYYLIIYSLWLFFTVIIMNLLATKKGSGIGFLVVCGGQLIAVTSLVLWEQVFPLDGTGKTEQNLFLLKCNPAAHLVLDWHTSRLETVNKKLSQFNFGFNPNQLNMEFDLNQTCIVFLILCIIAIILGCQIVERHEVLTDMETGGT